MEMTDRAKSAASSELGPQVDEEMRKVQEAM